MSARALAYISLGASLGGIVIFIAVVVGRLYQLVLPGLGVTLILAIVGIIFGHHALGSARSEQSSEALPIAGLVLGYGIALFFLVWLVGLILAIRALS
jgi:hypothetical protein